MSQVNIFSPSSPSDNDDNIPLSQANLIADSTPPNTSDVIPLIKTPKRTITRSVSRRLFMINDDSQKLKYEQLLLASIYGLNNSFTKKILVGIEVMPTFKFQTVIRLVSHSAQGITFDSKTWTQLQEKLELITTYFDSESPSDH